MQPPQMSSGHFLFVYLHQQWSLNPLMIVLERWVREIERNFRFLQPNSRAVSHPSPMVQGILFSSPCNHKWDSYVDCWRLLLLFRRRRKMWGNISVKSGINRWDLMRVRKIIMKIDKRSRDSYLPSGMNNRKDWELLQRLVNHILCNSMYSFSAALNTPEFWFLSRWCWNSSQVSEKSGMISF